MNSSYIKTSPNRLKNARILIIEDNADHGLLIKNALQQSFTGVELVLVSSESEVSRYLEECEQTGSRLPQLILLDLYLPERENGWNLLRLIKTKNLELGQTPVVVFSGSDHPEDITESYDRGAASYVVKPTNFAEWINYFKTLKEYWWETVSLPNGTSTF